MTHIYLIGIGGTGLSAIARVLLEMGHEVSGSDRAESQYLQDLRTLGATIYIGHDPKNLNRVDLVIRSSAIQDDNPEVRAARAARIPVLKRADFLGSLMENKTGIAVAGTHGKTSTTAMIAWLLTALKQDPTFIVGGTLSNLGINARFGHGTSFVIEADEYDRMFLGLLPSIEVVTNIEHDHPDCYPTPEDFQNAFMKFVSHLPIDGTLIACAEDPGANDLLKKAEKKGKNTLSYGLKANNDEGTEFDSYASVLSVNKIGGFKFGACILGNSVIVDLQVPGKHNILNALGALTVTQLLGIPLDTAAQAMGLFLGTGRRFDVRGEIDGIIIVDDYAHHPTEIRATLAAARLRYPHSPLRVVWQPHTYSRTRMLKNAFINSFDDADEIIVTEIYPAREPKQDFSAREVAAEIRKPAHFIPELDDVSQYLMSNLKNGDVLIVLSAGDANQISSQILEFLNDKRIS